MNTQQPTRKELESYGAIFHPGYERNGMMILTDVQTTADLSDLLQQGWVLVPGGIMEPTKNKIEDTIKGVLVLGCVLLGGYLLHKMFEPKPEEGGPAV